MPDRVLLTEKREQLLGGDYDSSNATHRNRKSRLTRSAQTTLDELTRVAESPHIDNTEVFDPDDVFRLLRALLTPDRDQIEREGGGLVSPENYTEEYRAYTDRLYIQMDKLMHPYRNNRFPDPPQSENNDE